MNVYDSRGAVSNTWNYNVGRDHVSQRDESSDINNFENLYLDYSSGDF